jgi:hypothetical protein
LIRQPARQPSERFDSLFSDITEKSIRSQIDDFYAQDVYFNDTLKTVRGREELKTYFLRMAQSAESVRCKTLDHSRCGANYCLRWVMGCALQGRQGTSPHNGRGALAFRQDGTRGLASGSLGLIGQLL